MLRADEHAIAHTPRGLHSRLRIVPEVFELTCRWRAEFAPPKSHPSRRHSRDLQAELRSSRENSQRTVALRQ